MKLTTGLFMGLCGLAAVTAGAPFVLSGIWAGGAAVLVAAAALGCAPFARWSWLADAGLLGFAAAGVIGIWIGQPPAAQVGALTLALMAWNLAYFTRRLRRFISHPSAGRETERRFEVESRHLVKLLLVGLVGFGAGLAALNVHVNLAFSGAIFLAVGGVIGLAAAVRALIRENERKAAGNAGGEMPDRP